MATAAFMDKIRGVLGQWGSSMQARVKAAVVERWLTLTGELGSSLAAYQDAMDVEDNGDSITLILRSTPALAQMVEDGIGPFDMRETLLRTTTKSIRISKKGALYLYVPLTHTTRQMRGLGGSRLESAARALKAYALKPAESLPAGYAPKLETFHTTDIFANMVRHDVGGGRSTYMTWRTISQAGRPWIHRGIVARNLMDRVRDEVPAIVASVLAENAPLPWSH